MAVISITSGIKSGGDELALKLSERLNYKAIYPEVISDCARKYNIMESDLFDKIEKLPDIWSRLTGDYRRLLIFIKCALLNTAINDNIIYYGPFGQLFFAEIPNVLKIKLEAPFESRVENVMRDMNLSYEKATEYIIDTDNQNNRMIKMLYDENWYNPSLYDLLINLNNITHDTVCSMIETVINKNEFQFNDKKIQHLKKILLESEVKAAIASDDKIWDQKITVVSSGDTIILRGLIKNKKLRDLIVETVSQVKSVKKCESYISLSSEPINMELYSKV